MRESDIAWFAGIYEGEGTVGISTHKGKGNYLHGQLIIGMTDEDVIRRLSTVFPGTVSRRDPGPKGTMPMWLYRVNKRNDLILVSIAMWPWLGQRRRVQLKGVLDRLQEQAQTRGAEWPFDNARLAM